MSFFDGFAQAWRTLHSPGCCSTPGVGYDVTGAEDTHKCTGDLSLPRDPSCIGPVEKQPLLQTEGHQQQLPQKDCAQHKPPPLPQNTSEQEVAQVHLKPSTEAGKEVYASKPPQKPELPTLQNPAVADASEQPADLLTPPQRADVQEAPPTIKKQPARKNGKPRQPKQGRAEANTEKAACPASRKEEDFERDLKMLKKGKQAKQARANATDTASFNTEAESASWVYSSCISEGERLCKKDLFKTFYREQYSKIGTYTPSDASKYETTDGLKIKGGHQYMPPPRDVVLPPDYKSPVGNLSKMQLREFSCTNTRRLVSILGDLFEVTGRPDKYGPDGPYGFMSGHDITWGLMCGDDGELQLDMYYDVFKAGPPDVVDRKLQGLISWWAFFEKEYGEPVGRLEVYNKEWELPEPPHIDTNECSVM